MELYFSEQNEAWIIEWQRETNIARRNFIYENYLHPGFEIMSRFVIAKFQLWKSLGPIDDLVADTTSWLWMKLSKFNVDKGSAFSFFNRVAFNYLTQKGLKQKKHYSRHLFVDAVNDNIEGEGNSATDLLDKLANHDEIEKEREDQILYALEKADMFLDYLTSENVQTKLKGKGRVLMNEAFILIMRSYKSWKYVNYDITKTQLLQYTGLNESKVNIYVAELKQSLISVGKIRIFQPQKKEKEK